MSSLFVVTLNGCNDVSRFKKTVCNHPTNRTFVGTFHNWLIKKGKLRSFEVTFC